MKVLIVVDMQNDFINGVLKTVEAQSIVKNVVEKVKTFNGHVYFTQDTHFENYLDTKEGKYLPIKHCIDNSFGHEIIEELKPYAKNIIQKNTFGCEKLIDELKMLSNIDTIEVIGVCTDICVISNVMLIKTYFPNVTINVIENCCAGSNIENHNKSLDLMKICHIEIV